MPNARGRRMHSHNAWSNKTNAILKSEILKKACPLDLPYKLLFFEKLLIFNEARLMAAAREHNGTLHIQR